MLMFSSCIPPPAGYRWYYVRCGDTLWSIARKHKADFFSLVNANGIRNPSRIYPGMKLKVPIDGTIVSRHSFKAAKVSKRVKKKPPSSSVSFSWPVKGKVVTHFGKSNLMRSLGVVIKTRDTSVKASAPGRVSFCGKAGHFGNTVIVKHSSGYHSVYGYLDKISVKTDDRIAGGALIGVCGNMRKYGGRVLYFEIRFNADAYDPLMYLK
ncbi:MAG: peptidoglycan DD-metalloendopeptidase family protein [Elusimicrobiota bacterium]|nr:peptidoglycan DD-metalloendopeptidase family protein [Elusimicrobiota bacterium]